MTARWTPADVTRDASDQTAQWADDALGELYAGRDEWPFDDLPDPWADLQPPPSRREPYDYPDEPPF
jgi:hypothetical protein